VDLRERPHGKTIVVDVRGAVDRESGETTRLAIALKHLVNAGYDVILLNVAELDTIDSVLLGAITQAHTTALRSGVKLKLLNVGRRLHNLLVLTKLDRFIEIAASEEQELEPNT
jgi:anti-anti-sigma factor